MCLSSTETQVVVLYPQTGTHFLYQWTSVKMSRLLSRELEK